MVMLSIAARAESLLREIQDKVHPEICESINDLFRHGEVGIGLENLCELLREEDVVLPAQTYESLIQIVQDAALDASYRDMLPAPLPPEQE